MCAHLITNFPIAACHHQLPVDLVGSEGSEGVRVGGREGVREGVMKGREGGSEGWSDGGSEGEGGSEGGFLPTSPLASLPPSLPLRGREGGRQEGR